MDIDLEETCACCEAPMATGNISGICESCARLDDEDKTTTTENT